MRDFPAGLIERLENCIESHFPRNFGDSSSQLNERRQGSSTDIDDFRGKGSTYIASHCN